MLYNELLELIHDLHPFKIKVLSHFCVALIRSKAPIQDLKRGYPLPNPPERFSTSFFSSFTSSKDFL